MALLTHSLLGPIRGRIGDLQFTQRNGKTYVSVRRAPSRREPTLAQVEQQLRFRQAVAYATHALADPTLGDEYRRLSMRLKKSPFGLAVRDWFRVPTIEFLDV